jgi:hypothetical protein
MWLLYLAFPLFSLLPGLPIVLLLERRESRPTLTLGEFLFRGVLAGFLLHSAVAFVLVEMGLFSLGPVLVAEGILGLLLATALWRRRKRLSWPRPSWEDLVPVGLLLLVALLLGQPHPAILGGSDPGGYIGIAANILRTGSLRAFDPVLAAMDPHLARTEFLFPNLPGLSMAYHRLPGFYALDAPVGTITPQFYHLYPLWLAFSFAAVGFPAGLLITILLAAWALVAVYYAGRAIVGKWPALAASLLLGLNPLFVWLGRHPLSEVPAQFLLFSSVYALVAFLRSDERDRVAGALAGAALGGFLHTRADSVLALAVVVVWLAFRLLTSGRRWSTLLPFLLPLGVSLGHWGLYLGLFTWGYTIDALGGALQFLLGPIVWPMIFLGTAGFLLLVFLARRGRLSSLLPAFRVAVAAGVLLLSAFGWLVWPRLSPPRPVAFYVWNGWQSFPVTQGQNLIHLAWYLAPLGLALGIAGFCLAVLRADMRRVAFIAGLALLYGLLYIYHSAEYPSQPYVMRRYFVVLIPTLVLMAGYILYRLARAHRWAGRLVAAALLLLLGWTFFSASQLPREVNDFGGIEAQIAGLAERFGPRDILLFTDVSMGTELAFPLQYLYQRSCFVLQRPQPDSLALRSQVEAWWSEGRSVYVLVSPGESRLSPAVFSLEWLSTFSLHWQQLEYPLDRPPQRALEQEIRYDLYRLADAAESSGQRVVDVGAGDYPYLAGGFWGPEQTPAGTTFRWTNGDATVELPGSWFVSTGPLTLTLDLQGWSPAEGTSFLEVWLGGRLLQTLRPGQEMREYAISVPQDLRAELAAQSTTSLRLRGPTWVPASTGLLDTRQLGVVLDRIAIQTSSSSPR